MKTKITFLMLFTATILINAQSLLIKENFQDWKAELGTSVSNKAPVGVAYQFNKTLADGTTKGEFSSNCIIVKPTQRGSLSGGFEGGEAPTNGVITLKGPGSYLQFPELTSIGKVIIKASAGTDQKEFLLQVSTDGGRKFSDVPNSTTAVAKSIIKQFEFNTSYKKPTILRITAVENRSIYIYDIEVYANK